MKNLKKFWLTKSKIITWKTEPKLAFKNKSDNKELQIKPLGQVSLTAGFNYKWLGLELGIGLPPNQQEKARKDIKLYF